MAEPIWEDAEKTTGMIKTGSGHSRVYNRKKWVENMISNCLVSLIRKPECINNIPTIGIAFRPQVYPNLTMHQKNSVINTIKENILSIMHKFLNNNPHINTEFCFLARLGINRNWKSNCAMCLTENIMGTTCTCGHTEIVVFRPCGHTICAKPCYDKICAASNENAEEAVIEFEYGNTVFNIISTDGTKRRELIKHPANLICHLCRDPVIEVFRAEETYNDKDCLQYCIDQLMPLLYNYINFVSKLFFSCIP
jgi:hypothetical protein